MIKIEHILEPIFSWSLILIIILCLKIYVLDDFISGILATMFLVFEGFGL